MCALIDRCSRRWVPFYALLRPRLTPDAAGASPSHLCSLKQISPCTHPRAGIARFTLAVDLCCTKLCPEARARLFTSCNCLQSWLVCMPRRVLLAPLVPNQGRFARPSTGSPGEVPRRARISTPNSSTNGRPGGAAPQMPVPAHLAQRARRSPAYSSAAKPARTPSAQKPSRGVVP